MSPQGKSVAIIGAGPVGLAAAAHALDRGMTPTVFEAGPKVAHAIRQWSHVQMFSPWEYNIDKVAARMLAETGWNSPDPQAYPTGGELIERYLEPLGSRTPLKDHIRVSSRVTAITRRGYDKVKTKGRESEPFEIRYENGSGPSVIFADAVIDASGTWFSPNPGGANGLTAIGEIGAAARIRYGMPNVLGAERQRYSGKRVAVVGAGHSAAGSLIDLARLGEDAPGTSVIWLVRGASPEKAFGGGVNDKLVERGELGLRLSRLVQAGRIQVESGFGVARIEPRENGLRIVARNGRDVAVDELIVATGFRPDTSFLRELRLHLDPAIECPPALAPLIDPNEHSCGTVRPHGARELSQPEAGFYFAGMKSYGRAPTFLMLTGYEQVRSIIAEIGGDSEAAVRVELVLPETGVCNLGNAQEQAGCCGGPAPAEVDACCKADEAAKADGRKGCGCG